MKFSTPDLEGFADWSGDRNPLHLDPKFAGQTSFGQPITHGILAVIEAFRQGGEHSKNSVKNLEIEFQGAVFPDVLYDVQSAYDQGQLSLSVRDGLSIVLKAKANFGNGKIPSLTSDFSWALDLDENAGLKRSSPVIRTVSDLQKGLELTGVYSTDSPPANYAQGSNLKSIELRVLGLCSYLVGMEVPGQKSLFTRLRLDFNQVNGNSDRLIYQLRTVRFDKEFRILDAVLNVATLKGECVATAEIRSYVPFSPIVTDVKRLQAQLNPQFGNLKGKVALVCGGSRGLGADLSACLALAGCHVYVSYRQSSHSANELQKRLADTNIPLNFLPGDAGDLEWCSSALETIKKNHNRLDLVVLNACSPPVAMSIHADSVKGFEQYIGDNLRLVQNPLAKFLPILSENHGAILAISSSFVEEIPPDFGHYVALKQAVEGLVKSASREFPNIYCLIARPPRLQTSWNDTPTGVLGALPTDTVASFIVHYVNEKWNSSKVDLLSDFSQPYLRDTNEPEASDPDLNLVIAGSFTVESLLPGLRFWFAELELKARVELTPYGQVLQELLNPASLLSSNTKGISVVLLCIQDWLRELPIEVTQSLEKTESYLSDTAKEFIQAIRTHRAHTVVETFLVICPSFASLTTEKDAQISRVETHLYEELHAIPGLQVISAQSFHSMYDVDAKKIEDPLRNEIAHVPYQDGYFHVLSTIIVRKVHRKTVLPRKVIVLDCDNTLWKGVVGEVGAQGIEFTPIHEQFHHILTGLSQNGILIALCSKNEEEDVWEVFEKREDFALKRDTIVASMINWNPKSQNIHVLASRLNLGLESFIFIDDNPVECAEVRAGCSEVLVLEWPQKSENAKKLLEHTWELDSSDGTKEDQKRTQLYREEFERQELQDQALSFGDFIENLNLNVEISPLKQEDVLRSSQLTLRTNQFNFTTRRRNENELQQLLADEKYVCRTIRVSDRFGDYGLVGFFILQKEGQEFVVDTFLLSCRVLGRGVEHHMAAAVGRLALEMGFNDVYFAVPTTKRNAPARNFLESISEGNSKSSGVDLLESQLSAESLAILRFDPTRHAGNSADQKKTSEETITTKINDGDNLRIRERQIFSTALELSTIHGLLSAIDGKGDVANLSPKLPVSENAPEDVCEKVYLAFSNSLETPIEELKKVDQLEALGCSSFKIVEITVTLTAQFPWLPSTLLFEHRSISEIIGKITEILENDTNEQHSTHFTSKASDSSDKEDGQGSTTGDIAVVGLSLRCAGANSMTELWELLHSGGSSVTQVPEERSPNNSRPHWACLLEKDSIKAFDAEFFGISPREAEYMDPQLRLLLEVAWEALEDAGSPQPDPETGVYVGAMYEDYVFRANTLANKPDSPYRCWESFSLANRLSQVLGLGGPSFAINTACSSSGVAIHLACSGLRAGECKVAIVGGVNLLLDPNRLGQLDRLGILSTTGKCRSFGADADGTVVGEGVGVVVLKPLSEAQRCGDRIYGVIKGTALSTGTGTVGFTAPNPQAQANAIRRSVCNAGIDPRSISYVEAHGTGTLLGDPIEIRGLTLAYMDKSLWNNQIRGPYAHKIASIKPNIGHLEAGAGIFGLIKVLLQFKHKLLVPSLHSVQTNPQISFEGSAFRVQQKLEPWEQPTLEFRDRETTFPRRAGLSSFGVGGANVHLILEEPPETSLPDNILFERPFHILTVSARNKESLDNQVLTFQEFLRSNQDLALEDISYTANIGRKHFDHRLAFFGSNQKRLMGLLEVYVAGEEPVGCVQGRRPKSTGPTKIAFLFTGQGAQYLDMGKALYNTHSVFRETLDQCVEILKPFLNRSILELMFAQKGSSDAPLLNQTGYTQPALFVIEYSLSKLWESWGIYPEIVIGHSVGEIAALCVAGGVSLEDGLKLTAARGQLMQALPSGGSMASVRAGEADVRKAIVGFEDRVSIAGLNSPEQTVISGNGDAIKQILAQLEVDGIKTKALSVSHAFHSHLMDPMIDEFKEVVKKINFSLPTIPFVSCVKGALVTDEIKNAEYWVQQVRNPVRFTEGMKALQEQSVTTFLEVGPQPVLLGMGKHCLPDEEVDWLPSLREGVDEWQTLLGSLAKLYVSGVSIDWKGFDAPYRRKIVTIPNYSFKRKQYWIDIPNEQISVIDKAFPETSPLGQFIKSRDESGFSDYVRNAITLSSEEATVLPKVFKALSLEAKQEQDEAEIGQKLYKIVWTEKFLGKGENSKKVGGIWIILMDQSGFGDILTKVLANYGTEYICVWPDAHFQQNDDGNFFIDPQQAVHFEKLWQSIYTQDKPIDGVLQLWNLDAPMSSELNVEALDQCQAITTESALHVVQTLAKRSEANKPAIWMITRDAVKTGEDVVNAVVSVAQTPLWGFARTIALEHHDIWGGIVDLSSNGDSTEEAELLFNAVSNANVEDQMALRGGKQFVPRLLMDEGKRLSAPVLDGKGSYLITGGLGALGLHTAGWLIKKGAKNLILTSRRGMEAPNAQEAVHKLEKLGANVSVIAADISCAEDVNKVFVEIKNSKLTLRGIIHAAGADALVSVAEMSVQELRELLAPKMKGAWLLHQHSLDIDLEMFICFSSISSIWGSSGRAHYGAANAFLDGLAFYRQSLELPALSVNWGPWKGGGMANEEQLQLLERMGNHSLAPGAALLVLEYLLNNSEVQGIVADIDWTQFRSVFEVRGARPLFSEIGDISNWDTSDLLNECPRWIALLREKSADQHSEFLTQLLQKEVAKTLGFGNPEEVLLDKGLFDIGMDSLMAIELANQIHTCLGIQMSATDFNQPNLHLLSEHLLTQLNPNALLGAEAKSKGASSVFEAEIKGNGLQAKWMEQLKKTPSGKRAEILVELLRKEVAKTLGLEDPEEVRLDRGLFEIGMDSLMAVELANVLVKRFGIQICASDFSLPHLEALAAHLLGQLPVAKEHQPGVIRFSPDLESETFDYHRKAFPERRTDWVVPRWRWMFLESAKRLNIEPMIWLYRDSDVIVSHCGAIPVKIKIGEKECTTAWFAESMTLESHRSKGAGGMILMQSKEDVPFNLSLGQEEFMRTMQIKLGWKLIGSLGVYFYPLRPHNILQGKLPKGPVSWAASAALSFTTEMKRVIGRPSNKWKPEICSINRFDEEHDELWKSVSKELTCTVVRDASFLNWKYVDQPGQNFTRIAIRKEGKVIALAIVSIKEPSDAYPYRRAFLADLIVNPSDSEAVWAILDVVRAHSIDEKADAIVFYVSCPALKGQLLSFGFRSRTPTRFLLVSTEGIEESEVELLSAMDNWYLTMGDSDLDRPW